MKAAAFRDASLATLVLLAAIHAGSGQGEHFDAALRGYAFGVVTVFFVTAYRAAMLWRHPAAALFARELGRALCQPSWWRESLSEFGRSLVTQRFLAARGRLRWLAHLSLSWGTLLAFLVTVPLVFGWMHFEVAGERRYRTHAFGAGLLSFDVDSLLGWLVFHVLHVCSVLVLLGCTYFVLVRLRARGEWHGQRSFHLAPLLALAWLAATGLALPWAAQQGDASLVRLAQVLHQVAVLGLLAGLPFGKLAHLLLRPLHAGAVLLRRTRASVRCRLCEAPLAPGEQVVRVHEILSRERVGAPAPVWLCTACRRRAVAMTHTKLVGRGFLPAVVQGRHEAERKVA